MTAEEAVARFAGAPTLDGQRFRADVDAVLGAAFEDWERLCGDPEALAAYRAETRELKAFDAETEPPE
jgi:hypothetical protein